MRRITRRDLLEMAAGTAIATGTAVPAHDRRNLTSPPLYSGSPIEVYTSTLSAKAGDKVEIHVSTMAKRFHMRIARVGYPDRVVWTRRNLVGKLFPTPLDAWENGCGWPAAISLVIPDSWPSGFYEISASTADTGATYRAFVVIRAPKAANKTLLVHATATYGAYNGYGGASLYVKYNNIAKGGFLGGERTVSFLRPWMPGFIWRPEHNRADALAELDRLTESDFDDRGIVEGTGIDATSTVAGFHSWDRLLITWLERNGYQADHAISSDLELHPELLPGYKLVLSVGHDEYWSAGMRDAVEGFVAKGGNACFFSGNVAPWQIRLENEGHTMVCYKDAPQEDPVFKEGKKQLTTTLWSSSIVNRPETSLTGLSAFYAGYVGFNGVIDKGPNGYLIYRPDHWVLKDTGLQYGDLLGHSSRVVHFEVDGCPIRMDEGLPYPSKDYDGPPTLEILGLCPAALPSLDAAQQEAVHRLLGNSPAAEALSRNHGHAVMGIFSQTGIVFCAGTCDWAKGLTGHDPPVEQVTRNLLNRLSV